MRSSISPIPSRWRGPVLGQPCGRPVDDLVHLGLVGAERAADRDAVDLAVSDRLRRLGAEVLVDAALHDPVDELPVRAVLGVPVQAAAQPAVRALGRARRVVAVGVERRALVEDEGEVGAQRRLDLHRGLGREHLLRAVEVRAEPHARLGDLEHLAGAVRTARRAALDLVRHGAVAHAEDLEAAGVGDDRPVPAHEVVQAAEPGDQLVAGVQEEVVRVAEDDVVAERGDLGGQQALDRRLRGERDEMRRADVAVRRVQDAGAGARARVARGDVQDAGECGHRGMVEAQWCWPASCPSPRTWAIRCSSSSSRSRRWGSRSRARPRSSRPASSPRADT